MRPNLDYLVWSWDAKHHGLIERYRRASRGVIAQIVVSIETMATNLSPARLLSSATDFLILSRHNRLTSRPHSGHRFGSQIVYGR
jgi:hypothetical protein